MAEPFGRAVRSRGGESLDGAHRFGPAAVSAEVAFEANDGHRGNPAGGREAGPVPARGVELRIVVFAAEDAGEDDGPGVREPRLVRPDERHLPVDVLEPQVDDGAQGAEGAGELHKAVASHDVVHAVAEEEADGVWSLAEERRDVVGVVERRVVVVGPARREQIVAHLRAVEGHLVLAQPGDVDDGAAQAGAHAELPAQEQRLGGAGGRDPAALPVGLVEKAHRPGRRAAPRRGSAGLVPDAHLPEHAQRACERGARIRDVSGLVRWHASAVPEVAAMAAEPVFRPRHQDLPGRLPRTTRAAADAPEQPGMGDVDAERVDAELAAEAFRSEDANRNGGAGSVRSQERNGGNTERERDRLGGHGCPGTERAGASRRGSSTTCLMRLRSQV